MRSASIRGAPLLKRTPARTLAFKNQVPDPTPNERLAFLREMFPKLEPEPELPVWSSLSKSDSATVPGRHQATLNARRERWATRDADRAATESDERVRVALAALFGERST